MGTERKCLQRLPEKRLGTKLTNGVIEKPWVKEKNSGPKYFSQTRGGQIMRFDRIENYAKIIPNYAILCDIVRKLCDIFWSTSRTGEKKRDRLQKKHIMFKFRFQIDRIQTELNPQQQ